MSWTFSGWSCGHWSRHRGDLQLSDSNARPPSGGPMRTLAVAGMGTAYSKVMVWLSSIHFAMAGWIGLEDKLFVLTSEGLPVYALQEGG